MSKLVRSQRSFGLVSYANAGLIVVCIDFIFLISSSIIAGTLYHQLVLKRVGNIGAFAGVGLIAAVLFVLINSLRGLYKIPALCVAAKQGRGVATTLVVILLLIIALLFLLKVSGEYSRGAIVGFAILALGSVLAVRWMVSAKLDRLITAGALRGYRTVLLGIRKNSRRFRHRTCLGSTAARK
jgi:hypothetical protein